jgi:hypothetical protein
LFIGEFFELLQDFAIDGIDALVAHASDDTLSPEYVTWGVHPTYGVKMALGRS